MINGKKQERYCIICLDTPRHSIDILLWPHLHSKLTLLLWYAFQPANKRWQLETVMQSWPKNVPHAVFVARFQIGCEQAWCYQGHLCYRVSREVVIVVGEPMRVWKALATRKDSVGIDFLKLTSSVMWPGEERCRKTYFDKITMSKTKGRQKASKRRSMSLVPDLQL